jgi:hypothetical protein
MRIPQRRAALRICVSHTTERIMRDLKAHLTEGFLLYVEDPADSLFQRGFLAAMLEIGKECVDVDEKFKGLMDRVRKVNDMEAGYESQEQVRSSLDGE